MQICWGLRFELCCLGHSSLTAKLVSTSQLNLALLWTEGICTTAPNSAMTFSSSKHQSNFSMPMATPAIPSGPVDWCPLLNFTTWLQSDSLLRVTGSQHCLCLQRHFFIMKVFRSGSQPSMAVLPTQNIGIVRNMDDIVNYSFQRATSNLITSSISYISITAA